MDFLKQILSEALKSQTIEVHFPKASLDLCQLAESTAYQILLTVGYILADDLLSDADKLQQITYICETCDLDCHYIKNIRFYRNKKWKLSWP